MLIRTQDGEGLINLKNFLGLCTGDDDTTVEAVYPLAEDLFEAGEPSLWWLGKYSTHEKALKVMDMIQKFYCRTSQIQGDVFQMPQDNEVEVET